MAKRTLARGGWGVLEDLWNGHILELWILDHNSQRRNNPGFINKKIKKNIKNPPF
jgi:hypothetical protein